MHNLESIDELVRSFPQVEGGLLELLHLVQRRLGYIPPSSIPVIARHLQLSSAEVHGVASFYHDFRSAPAGNHVIQVCRAITGMLDGGM